MAIVKEPLASGLPLSAAHVSAVALNSYNKEIEGPGEKIKINYLHVGVFQLNICYSTVPFRGKPVSPV